jgi:hypothetical protein
VEQTKVKWYRFGTAIVRNGKQASSLAKTQQLDEQAKQRIAVLIILNYTSGIIIMLTRRPDLIFRNE